MSVVSEKSMFCYKFNKIKSKHKNKPPTFSLGAFLWSQKESNIGVLHKNSWLLHNETTYLANRLSSPSMRTNPSLSILRLSTNASNKRTGASVSTYSSIQSGKRTKIKVYPNKLFTILIGFRTASPSLS